MRPYCLKVSVWAVSRDARDLSSRANLTPLSSQSQTMDDGTTPARARTASDCTASDDRGSSPCARRLHRGEHAAAEAGSSADSSRQHRQGSGRSGEGRSCRGPVVPSSSRTTISTERLSTQRPQKSPSSWPSTK